MPTVGRPDILFIKKLTTVNNVHILLTAPSSQLTHPAQFTPELSGLERNPRPD